MPPVDEYFGTLDPSTRAAFERVLAVATAEVPDATQGTSYGMAALMYRGRPLLGFRTAKQHLSVFPFSPAAVDAARDWLSGSRVSKGTIRFTAAEPLPDEAVRAVVRARASEIEGGG